MSLEGSNYKKEQIFWVLSGFFLASMAMLNIIGLTKFVSIFGLTVAVGVLPYPITFLCTDLISEIYGKKRANFLVFLGLFINIFVLFFMWFGDALPSVPVEARPPWQDLNLSQPITLPNGQMISGETELFGIIFATTSGAVLASMVAYMFAQFCDVYIFHYLKELTNGKYMWLRNNASTLVSQFVDSLAVVGITFGAVFVKGQMDFSILLTLFWSNYAFKMIAALLDTPFFYLFTHLIKKQIEVKA